MTKKIRGEINRLANLFYRVHGCQVPMTFEFDKSNHGQEKMMFELAKVSHEYWEVDRLRRIGKREG